AAAAASAARAQSLAAAKKKKADAEAAAAAVAAAKAAAVASAERSQSLATAKEIQSIDNQIKIAQQENEIAQAALNKLQEKEHDAKPLFLAVAFGLAAYWIYKRGK
ncbi:MAG: hypothetical protein IKT98_02190, partial [Selenomonadaceae bacterium]|nr:hypothetical protein [Selenomonadaceae bacterium]